MMEMIEKQARQAVEELLEAANLRAGDLMVIGCSSSEMVGQRIGKGSSMEAAQAAFAALYTLNSPGKESATGNVLPSFVHSKLTPIFPGERK